jgi:hypothetical protein
VLAWFAGELDSGIWLLDTDTPGDVIDAHRIPGDIVSVSSKYVDDTGLLVGLGFHNAGQWSLVTLDPDTGQVVGTLLKDGGAGVDQGTSTISVHASGKHLLLVTVSGSAPGSIARWSSGQRAPRRLIRARDGVIAAAWG